MSLPQDFKPLLYEFRLDGDAPIPPEPPTATDLEPEVKQAVRSLLRAGGHKPSGRGRPASESLLKALKEGHYPKVHPVVDFFNAVSVKSGFPISVLDRELLQGTWSFRLGHPEEQYPFNPSGQQLRLKNLLVLCDQLGPTASPVKDAQRTKVSENTTHFFVVVWATQALPQQRDLVQALILEGMAVSPFETS